MSEGVMEDGFMEENAARPAESVAGHSQYDDENINKLIEATKSFQTLKY